MLATVMGGGAYSHVCREGEPANAAAPLLFWGGSVYIALAAGQQTLETVAVHLALGALGAVVGIAVFAASAKGKSN